MSHWDVAIIGAGPTGLTAANLLGAMGVRTLLLERNATTVNQPRAVSIDDEALRTMQAAGVLDDVLADVALDYGVEALDPRGRTLFIMRPQTREYGFPRRNAFVQPVFEATLRRTLKRHSCVEAMFDTQCTALRESADKVELTVLGADGIERSLSAAFVIGADGASSLVRKAIGASLEGATYEQRWLIVDIEGTRDRRRESLAYSDPARPGVNIPGPNGLRRFEFMLLPQERDEEVMDERFVRALLAKYGPDEGASIVRRQIYTFHARVANRWQTKRVFLCGDAAHLSPPFAGQGVNSAFRDVHNITWKLAAVVRSRMGMGLLSTYQQEREPHARALIDLAIRNGRMLMVRPGPRTVLRHWGYRIGRLLPAVDDFHRQMKHKPKATYTRGFITPSANAYGVGRLAPQPRLETMDRRSHLMDDLIGCGFALLVLGAQAQAVAEVISKTDLGIADLRILAIVPGTYNLDRERWTRWAARDVSNVFGDHGASSVMLLRPDRYVALHEPYSGDPAVLADRISKLVRPTWN